MDFADSLLVGDIRRTYLVHCPDNTQPHSLLLAFHGGGGRAKGIQRIVILAEKFHVTSRTLQLRFTILAVTVAIS
jgi:poly(3-hydroxybutyrate) depolymerase